MKVEKVYQNIGYAILYYRILSGMTQQDLADRMKMCRGSIANIEGGNQRLMIHDLYHFAKALRVKPQALLRGAFNKKDTK